MSFIFFVALNSWVVNVGGLAQILVLCFSIIISDDFLLVCGETEELAFFLRRQSLELLDLLLHLLLQHGQQWVAFISHCSCLNTLKSRFEGLFLDFFLLGLILK